LIDAIVKEIKKSGGFTLPSFGTFRVAKTKARKGLNPRTGEAIKVKAGKTVRFKASPFGKQFSWGGRVACCGRPGQRAMQVSMEPRRRA
jgi:nucleoid DNA-binding protein